MPGDEPPTYDSVVSETTATDGASGGAEAAPQRQKDASKQDVTSEMNEEALRLI